MSEKFVMPAEKETKHGEKIITAGRMVCIYAVVNLVLGAVITVSTVWLGGLAVVLVALIAGIVIGVEKEGISKLWKGDDFDPYIY